MNELLSTPPTNPFVYFGRSNDEMIRNDPISTSVMRNYQNIDMNCNTKSADTRRKCFAKKSYSDTTRRCSSPPSKANSCYPDDLSPTNHPILRDHPSRPRSSSALDTPFGKTALISANPTTSTNPDKSRKKGLHQPLTRYHTLPITFEEISEIDEELYQQQNSKEDEDEKRNQAALRRTSSFGCYSSPNYKGSKARSYSAGAVLFSSSPPNSANGSNRNKQRSQESLMQLGISTLPTIPEEWRQQQHQATMEQQAPTETRQRSQSVDGAMEMGFS